MSLANYSYNTNLQLRTHRYISDNVSRVSGPYQEHDLPVWTRHVSDVWRQDGGVSHLSEACGEKDTCVLSYGNTLPSSDIHLLEFTRDYLGA